VSAMRVKKAAPDSDRAVRTLFLKELDYACTIVHLYALCRRKNEDFSEQNEIL
jgi:hypothetical protein